jgi:hypothetical protein
VLLLGNYHSGPGGRVEMLREAWADAGIEWRELGGQSQTMAVPEAMAQVDVVVGYGRSALEAMACGRPAYIHDHSGSQGWITPDSYALMEGGGFAVAPARLPPDISQLRADLDLYRPEWGRAGHDLARVHHDSRDHAAEVVRLIKRLGRASAVGGPSAVRALSLLAEAQLRAELTAEHYRMESKQWFSQYNHALEAMAEERGAWEAARAQVDRERDAMRRARDASQAAATAAEERLASFRRTRRYRLAQALGAPLDRLRGRPRG